MSCPPSLAVPQSEKDGWHHAWAEKRRVMDPTTKKHQEMSLRNNRTLGSSSLTNQARVLSKNLELPEFLSIKESDAALKTLSKQGGCHHLPGGWLQADSPCSRPSRQAVSFQRLVSWVPFPGNGSLKSGFWFRFPLHPSPLSIKIQLWIFVY